MTRYGEAHPKCEVTSYPIGWSPSGIPEPLVTRTMIPELRLDAGRRSGQHVQIRILSSVMGWIGWAEVHPFTIASVTKVPKQLVLLCENPGGWTKMLYKMAKVPGYGSEVEDRLCGKPHKLFYGGVCFRGSRTGRFRSGCEQSEGHRTLQDPKPLYVYLHPNYPFLSQGKCLSIFDTFPTAIHSCPATEHLHTITHFFALCFSRESKSFPGVTLTPSCPQISKVLDGVIRRTSMNLE
ncbi:hypothetical protein BKA82DRAFT_2580440 [Pisolithus tinctorius]|nr:hypothetical protein BKA82DRAFT_2580440 [Pisolithus tinctorius]